MEQTDIRALDPARLPEPPDFAAVDVSFISLKLVLPAHRQALLTPRATPHGADQAAIRSRTPTPRRASCATRPCINRSAMTSPHFCRPKDGASAG